MSLVISDTPATGPGRPLGQKRKPQLRLALGYRDEQRRGAPVKTEYFIPHGDDRAIQKFQSVYGQKPRAIDIRLPSSLAAFLDIRHVAFAGGQGDGGGVLKAIGQVNFAQEGTLGGPDKLTVFNLIDTGKKDRNDNAVRELQVDEVYIDDVNDPAAVELGVYLQATVTFGIPDVLGFGGTCEIRSRGKETIDTLWMTAVDIYGALGSRASMILRPKLVLKESSMTTPRGQKAQLFVVDLYVPESLDEIVGRLREMRDLMPGGPAAAVYGPTGELVAPEIPPPLSGEGTGSGDGPRTVPQPSDPAVAAPDLSDEPGLEEAEVVEGEIVEEQASLTDSGSFVPPSGKFSAGGEHGPKTLTEILATGTDGEGWLKWALARIAPEQREYHDAIWAFAQAEAPAVYQAALAAQEARA